MSVQMNASDPRATRTRQHLLSAFTALVRQKGFEATTVKEIAERAMVNRATFYAHFIDKFDVLHYQMTATFSALLHRHLEREAHSREETVRCLFLAVCEFHSEFHSTCSRSYQTLSAQYEPQIKQMIESNLFLLITDGLTLSPQELQKRRTAAVLLSCGIYGAAYHWNREGRTLSAEAFVQAALPLVMNGLSEFPSED